MVGIDGKKTGCKRAFSKTDADGRLRCPTPQEARETRRASIECILAVTGRRSQDVVLKAAQGLLSSTPSEALSVLRLLLEGTSTTALLYLAKEFMYEFEHGEAEGVEGPI